MNNDEHTDGERHTSPNAGQLSLYTWWQQTSTLTQQTKTAAVVALILFLLLLALGFMASRSLPGSTLYGMKTGLLEPLQGSVQFGTKSKAQYQVRRMEARLDEIKRLSSEEEVTQEEIDAYKEQVYAHHSKFTELINLPDNGMTYPDTLSVLGSFASVAAAIEEISENTPGLEALGEEMEDVRRQSVNLFNDTTDRFVERETPQNIYAFITQQLQAVSRKLENTELDQAAVDDAQVYINRVAPAVEKGDFPRAISAIAEALRFIEVEEYGGRIEPETTESTTTATATPQDDDGSATQEAAVPEGAGSFSFPQ